MSITAFAFAAAFALKHQISDKNKQLSTAFFQKKNAPSITSSTEELRNIKHIIESKRQDQSTLNALLTKLNQLIASKHGLSRPLSFIAHLDKAIVQEQLAKFEDQKSTLEECLVLSKNEKGQSTLETAETQMWFGYTYAGLNDYNKAKKLQGKL